jgi:hypothetical protein
MPRLTEQEQQEILRFLEADKPLPDKFRFLLFEDKREVELVWNGKSSEVSNVVLPFQVIKQVAEPRAERPEGTALQPETEKCARNHFAARGGPAPSSPSPHTSLP